VAYKLSLPSHWKIHNVFHASLLTPYRETQQHGPNFLEPPPDVIEGEPEWEVERILRERTYGCWKKKQYLMRWKGYLPSHDEWIPEEDLQLIPLVYDYEQQINGIHFHTRVHQGGHTIAHYTAFTKPGERINHYHDEQSGRDCPQHQPTPISYPSSL
jgi:hypothetical protein